MPHVEKCPHCEEEITEEAVIRYKESQKEKRFKGLFNSQPNVKKLNSAMGCSLALMVFGIFVLPAAISLFYEGFAKGLIFVAGEILGGVPGFVAGALLERKVDSAYSQFRSEHWSTFESGN